MKATKYQSGITLKIATNEFSRPGSWCFDVNFKEHGVLASNACIQQKTDIPLVVPEISDATRRGSQALVHTRRGQIESEQPF